jgi:AcrR family transcriptional regulator
MSNSSQETRRRIVETANELFHVYGFQKTTVADIARELGMSPANVYRFFASKAELTKAVTAIVTSRMREAVWNDPPMPETDASATLREMVRRQFHYVRGHYAGNRKIHDLLEAAMEEAWDVIILHKEEMRRDYAGVIRAGIEKGEFPPQDADNSALLFQHSLVIFFHPSLVAENCRCLPEGMQDRMLEPMLDFAIAALREGRFAQVPDEVRATIG